MDRFQTFISAAEKPTSPLADFKHAARYNTAVFLHKGKPYAALFFDDDDPHLLVLGDPRADNIALDYEDFLDYTKAHKKELVATEDDVVDEGGLAVELPASIVSTNLKKLKTFIDQKRLIFATRSAFLQKERPESELQIVVVPASEKDMWFADSFAAEANKTTFLAFVSSVVREQGIVPSLRFATRTSVCSYLDDAKDPHPGDSLANMYIAEHLQPTKRAPTTGTLFGLLYTLWYIHTDLKFMLCNVKDVAFVEDDPTEGKPALDVYILDDGNMDCVFVFEAGVRAVISDYSEALLMRDGILLQGGKVDSFRQIKKLQKMLKERLSYDLDILDFRTQMDENDNWVDLYHMIFALDYADACDAIAAKNNAIPETKPIRKLCEQFLTGTLAMMHDRKRPKLTFNNLWDKILGVFKEHRWASVATKRLEKYEVGSVYRYDELFNYCPDMECFDGFKLE
jgi:hypothetical protein